MNKYGFSPRHGANVRHSSRTFDSNEQSTAFRRFSTSSYLVDIVEGRLAWAIPRTFRRKLVDYEATFSPRSLLGLGRLEIHLAAALLLLNGTHDSPFDGLSDVIDCLRR